MSYSMTTIILISLRATASLSFLKLLEINIYNYLENIFINYSVTFFDEFWNALKTPWFQYDPYSSKAAFGNITRVHSSIVLSLFTTQIKQRQNDTRVMFPNAAEKRVVITFLIARRKKNMQFFLIITIFICFKLFSLDKVPKSTHLRFF